MAVVVAENETTHGAAAASDHDNARPLPAAKLLDPQLSMAARRGDSELLKELLQLKKDEEHAHGMLEAAAASSSEVVIVDVVPRRRSPAPAAAPPPPPTSSRLAALPPPLVDGVTLEGDTLLHVVAACGDGEDFLRCAKTIVHDYRHKRGAAAARQALEARNSKGDTPLHCAAAAGNANMISCLVDLLSANAAYEAAAVKAFLEMQNKCGETALHQAVHAAKNKEACIDQLMDVDSELACIPREDGASPLYLAISVGEHELEIARHLYVKSKGKLSYSGPDGRNVLHAAVSLGQQALPMVLEWLKQAKKSRHCSTSLLPPAGDALLSQLTSERDKRTGSTPLHLAASQGGWNSSVFVSTRLGRRYWRPLSRSNIDDKKTMLLLVDANVSTVYVPAGKQGLYPIHVAASAGSWRNVSVLLERCPDCATLRDAQGRTFLHAAADKGRWLVVHDVCEDPGLSWILNVQDNNGDTALHLAVRAERVGVCKRLIQNDHVRLDVLNNEGARPIDLTWSKMPSNIYYAWDPCTRIRKSLLQVGAPYGELRADLLYENVRPKGDDENKVSENLTNAAQVLGIVSVLVTTVTFASAFTLPGGYRSAGDDAGGVAGTPVLAGSYAFDAFILSDVLAFSCSFMATVVLVFAGVPAGNLSSRFKCINFAYSMMMNSGRSLMAAFALGLYVVLLPIARTLPILVPIIIAATIYALMPMGISDGILESTAPSFIVARSQKRSNWEIVFGWFVYALEHFWSFIVIFGVPAVRKWQG